MIIQFWGPSSRKGKQRNCKTTSTGLLEEKNSEQTYNPEISIAESAIMYGWTYL